jgi:hypothetical protein
MKRSLPLMNWDKFMKLSLELCVWLTGKKLRVNASAKPRALLAGEKLSYLKVISQTGKAALTFRK